MRIARLANLASMGKPFQNTISGVLRRRAELIEELQSLRERMAAITNDIASFDRVLSSLGYEESIVDRQQPRCRTLLFYRNELRQYILQEMKQIDAPVSSRDLALKLITAEGKDCFDRRLTLDVIKRMGKALQTMKKHGLVTVRRSPTSRQVWQLTERVTADRVNR
jgi:hypothetical protein